MSAPQRKISLENYEGKWKCFLKYLKDRNLDLSEITLDIALEFLTYLFLEKGFEASTIAHYKTAITEPLRLGFNIDLNTPAASNLIKGMKIRRPARPPVFPDWCLNKVLSFIVRLPKSISIEMQLMKTSFLLLLATGWRISELQACIRDENSCRIIKGNLWIRPNPLFLAKNEKGDKRREPKIIPPLIHKGRPSCLCPVEAFKTYMKRSKPTATHNLWVHPSSGKPLTVWQLKNLVCKLIVKGDPEARAKVHDIRKFAASYALIHLMNETEMASAMDWSSAKIFWKFYLTPGSPLSREVILPTEAMSTLSLRPGTSKRYTHGPSAFSSDSDHSEGGSDTTEDCQ